MEGSNKKEEKDNVIFFILDSLWVYECAFLLAIYFFSSQGTLIFIVISSNSMDVCKHFAVSLQKMERKYRKEDEKSVEKKILL